MRQVPPPLPSSRHPGQGPSPPVDDDEDYQPIEEVRYTYYYCYLTFLYFYSRVVGVVESLAIGVRAKGRGATAPLTRAKPLFFGKTLNFSGKASSQKWKIYIILYLLNEKT